MTVNVLACFSCREKEVTYGQRSGLLTHSRWGLCTCMSERVPSPDPVGQDLSAEETEAVLGLDADGNHMVMLSVIPGKPRTASPESSSGTCGARGGGLEVQPPGEPLLPGQSWSKFPRREKGILHWARCGGIRPAQLRMPMHESLKSRRSTVRREMLGRIRKFHSENFEYVTGKKKLFSTFTPFSAHCFYDLILCHLSHAES